MRIKAWRLRSTTLWFIIRIIKEMCKAPTLQLKVLNKHTHITYIEMENVIHFFFIYRQVFKCNYGHDREVASTLHLNITLSPDWMQPGGWLVTCFPDGPCSFGRQSDHKTAHKPQMSHDSHSWKCPCHLSITVFVLFFVMTRTLQQCCSGKCVN